MGLVSQLSVRLTLAPACRGKHQICEASAVKGYGRRRQVLWASPTPLESGFGPSWSWKGGATTSIALGTGHGSSSKNTRET